MNLLCLTLVSSLAMAQEPVAEAEEASTTATETETTTKTTTDPGNTRTSRFYAALNTGLTSVPYDSEFGLLAGIRLSRFTSFEVVARTEALSLLWNGSWYNLGVGLRLTPGPVTNQLRPTFGLSYAGGALSNNYTTEGSPITEVRNGVTTTYPTKVTWKRHVGYGRMDLDGGIRWQREDTRAFICALLGLYTIPKSSASDTWSSREKLGVDAQLIDTTLRDLEGAGFSHWFEEGYTTAYIRIVLGMDF